MNGLTVLVFFILGGATGAAASPYGDSAKIVKPAKKQVVKKDKKPTIFGFEIKPVKKPK